MNYFPIVYLTLIISLFLILTYILTKQIFKIVYILKILSEEKNTIITNKYNELYYKYQLYWYYQYYLKGVEYYKLLKINLEMYDKEQLANIYFKIGNLYELLEKYTLAVVNYEVALKMKPQSLEILLSLYTSLKKQKDYKSASLIRDKIKSYFPKYNLII